MSKFEWTFLAVSSHQQSSNRVVIVHLIENSILADPTLKQVGFVTEQVSHTIKSKQCLYRMRKTEKTKSRH